VYPSISDTGSAIAYVTLRTTGISTRSHPPALGEEQGVHSDTDFARIYQEHAAGVVRAAARVLRDTALAEDVAQEVFLGLWRGSGYDAARGPLGPYLRLQARSRALDVLRNSRAGDRRMARLKERTVLDSAVAEAPQHTVLRAADRDLALSAVRRLPVDQRRAIGLTYWADLTAQQAADLDGIPLGTAKSRLRLGLHKLARDPVMCAT
jgi:RNA polymerase sigma-70 factor (ECF subfamily)